MPNDQVAGPGTSAVEFEDSAAANSVESRLSLLRALVEDTIRSNETTFTKQITVDGRTWTITVQQQP